MIYLATGELMFIFTTDKALGALLELQGLCQADHGERSEAQLRKGSRTWAGSV